MHLKPLLRVDFFAVFIGIFCITIVSAVISADLPAPELSHELTRLDKPIEAPGFTLENLDEEKLSLHDFRGQVVMLNFWATWCPPCRREIPSMESIYQDLGKDGFVVLAINEFEEPDHVFAYTGQLSVDPTFPILFDRDSTVAQLYGVKGLPTTVLIDKQGKVVYRAVGGRDFDHAEVRKIVRSLMNQ
ncbi:Thioredoxin family protein [hydrothermal vent metagenome]|uniref:Thioredoxin family protein n=1 Tax=hydrothermal vent metagenome TaxID=652676 RepID=A0A3B0Z7G8_9ZZZZ